MGQYSKFKRGRIRQQQSRFYIKVAYQLKETGESIYWLKLLHKTQLIDDNAVKLINEAKEIKRVLVASLNTAKK